MESIPENTVMNEFFTEGTIYKTEEIVYANDWFKIKSKDDFKRQFYEFCNYGYTNSVLSIIWEE